MIDLDKEKSKWNTTVGAMSANEVHSILELGQHWIQIKTLERNSLTIYGTDAPDIDFEKKMKGVADFLFDLRKKIGQ